VQCFVEELVIINFLLLLASLIASNLLHNINQRDASQFDDDFLHAINTKC